jgi:hypothetical protein
VRGFDIEYRVEGLVGEGQAFGVAVHEVQPRQIMPLSAKSDAVCVVVQPSVGSRTQRAHTVRGSTAVAAADLENLFATEIRLGRREVVELNPEPVGFIGRRKRQAHRRILLIAVVEKNDVLRIEPTSQKGIPVLAHHFLEKRRGADVVESLLESGGHTKAVCQAGVRGGGLRQTAVRSAIMPWP